MDFSTQLYEGSAFIIFYNLFTHSLTQTAQF